MSGTPDSGTVESRGVVLPPDSACASGELESSGVRVRFRLTPPAGDYRRDAGREDTGVGVLRPRSFPPAPGLAPMNHDGQLSHDRRVAARCSSRFRSHTARYRS